MEVTHVETRGLLKLRPVLQQWVEINIAFCEEWQRRHDRPEAPWWFNEQTSVSVFAAAIWKAGGLCLEEISARRLTKHGTEDESPEKTSGGRCDLYFSLNITEYCAEAKQFWTDPEARDSQQQIDNLLADATKQVRCIHRNVPNFADTGRIAITFAVPEIPYSRYDENEDLIKDWMQQVSSVRCDAYACVFPDIAWKKPVRYPRNTKEWYYPGVAVFLRDVTN